jgi:hypothetical protein
MNKTINRLTGQLLPFLLNSEHSLNFSYPIKNHNSSLIELKKRTGKLFNNGYASFEMYYRSGPFYAEVFEKGNFVYFHTLHRDSGVQTRPCTLQKHLQHGKRYADLPPMPECVERLAIAQQHDNTSFSPARDETVKAYTRILGAANRGKTRFFWCPLLNSKQISTKSERHRDSASSTKGGACCYAASGLSQWYMASGYFGYTV